MMADDAKGELIKSEAIMRAVIGFLLLIFLPLLPHAAAAETLRLTNGDWPPFQSPELEGYGTVSQVVSESFALVGIEVEYGFFPWARALKLAEAGAWDGSFVWSVNAERRRGFHVSDPVLISVDRFIHLRERTFDWQGFGDLAGYRVGIPNGYFYGEAFHEAAGQGKFILEEAGTEYENLRKLLLGRIDLLPLNDAVGWFVMGQRFSAAERAKVAIHPRAVREVSYMLLLSRKLPGGEQLILRFNQGLARLKASGRYDRLMHTGQLLR